MRGNNFDLESRMTTQLEFSSPIAPPLPIHRFSVEEYHQLGKIGVLSPEDKVELLEGWIVEKMNQRPIHGFIVRFLAEWFQERLPAGLLLQCQLPIATERSEPEPDIAIVLGTHDDFRENHPNGMDCRLVIEVADTPIEKDRAKAAIYATAGVEEYWIVNIGSKCIERFHFTGSSDTKPIASEIFSVGQQVVVTIESVDLVFDTSLIFA